MVRWALILTVFLAGTVAAGQPPLATSPFWTTSEQDMVTTGMIWRDCDNDGDLDVFFSNGNDIERARNMIYLFGGGRLPGAAAWLSDNGDYSGHCAVGDVNDDGYPDFVVSNYLGVGFTHPNLSNLYLNDGGLPHTTPDWNTADSIFSFSCALGDVDNDGDLDLMFATGEGYYNDLMPDRLYLNEGGSFGTAPVWQSAASTAALDVTWGDVDNDGDLDVAFAYDDNRATALFYNNGGTLETTPSWQSSSVQSGNTLVFGDVDGDDWLDLIVAYNYQTGGSGYFRVYFNDGAGHLNPNYGWQSSNGGYGSALALYDYDHDGDDDLAAGRWFNEVYVYENTGATFTAAPVWQSDVEVVSEELAWADLDADGVLTFEDTIAASGAHKLFYLQRHPLYAIDSVVVDGAKLGWSGFCYDLVSGWVSLAETPTYDAVVYYRYSMHNDLVTANWDDVNMAFANTTPPFVNASAAPTFGPSPLTVQFHDLSTDALSRSWVFGDGAASDLADPEHTYTDPGFYDVTLSVTKPDRVYSYTFDGFVSAYADTLSLTDAPVESGRARVDVLVHNYLPLGPMTIPFGWSGTLSLRFDSVSVAGRRAQYFEDVRITSTVPAWKVATVYLDPGAQPYLPPGDGPVLSLWFTHTGTESSGSNPVFVTAYSGRELNLSTYAGYYVPETTEGAIFVRCCQGLVGDANGIAGDEPTIGDISAIVDHLYITGADLPCLGEADANLSGGLNPQYEDITILDISVIIDHLYINLTPLPPCP